MSSSGLGSCLPDTHQRHPVSRQGKSGAPGITLGHVGYGTATRVYLPPDRLFEQHKRLANDQIL